MSSYIPSPELNDQLDQVVPVTECLAHSPSSHTDDPSDLPVQRIERRVGWRAIDLRELWRYRELLYFLTWRDINVRYKQTVLGAAWAILQPLMTMIVFSIFFGRLAGLEAQTGDLPYPIFVYAGLLPWTFFTNALANAGNSVVGSQNLVTKVYFPRLIIPLASVGAGLVDFLIAFVILVGMMFWYGVFPGLGILLLPIVFAFIVLAATGMGAILSALTVAYRDFRYVVPFLVQIWLYVTPVIYPAEIVPEQWRWVLALNPMAGLIESFRFSLLAHESAWSPMNLLISCGVTLLAFIVGVFYFRRLEHQFADII